MSREAMELALEALENAGEGLEELFNSAGFYRKREWVSLTDEEIEDFVVQMHNEIKVRLMGRYRIEDIYLSIEAKLKEKNHG